MGTHLLIIGAGNYVCGRGTKGYGTVLPAVLQSAARGRLLSLSVAATSRKSLQSLAAKYTALERYLGIELDYRKFPEGATSDPFAYRQALAELPDPGAVIIVTPDPLHTEMMLEAVRERKHVLVVKPFTPTVAEGVRVLEAARDQGVYGAVEFHKRWDLANLKIRDMLGSGALGNPLTFQVEYSQRKTIPTSFFRSWAHQTSIFQYLGVHYVDLIFFLTGAYPRRVLAIGQRKWLFSQGIDTWDAVQAVIEWDGGFSSTILTHWIDSEKSSAMSQQRLQVIGTEGRIDSDQTRRGVQLVTDIGGVEEFNPYFSQAYQIPGTGRFQYQGYGIQSIEQFLDDVVAIQQGNISLEQLEQTRPTFRQALISTAVVEAAHQSLQGQSCWVDLTDRLEGLKTA